MTNQQSPRSTLAVCLLATALAWGCGGDTQVGPVGVSPADGHTPMGPGAGTDGVRGIVVVDANDELAGVLVRRGSDDNVANRAIYDIVTVFHPDSGIFYELTMSDGQVRYPNNTLFTSFNCDEPVGVGIGGCTDCRAGFGTGFLHNGAWYVVEGGADWGPTDAGSIKSGGVATECVAHGTANAKSYPTRRVNGAAPPTVFAPPLSFRYWQ